MNKTESATSDRKFGMNRYVPTRGNQKHDPDLFGAAETKVCRTCKIGKPHTDYHRSPKNGRMQVRGRDCRDCFNRLRRESLGRFGYLKWFLPKKYGITVEDYHRMRAEQNYRCAICGLHEDTLVGNHNRNERRLQVDHCHDSNKVRGLLCGDCNVAVGRLRDSATAAFMAFLYLEKWRPIP